MRIGVVGAGAVGGTFAALLDRAGHEVVVTARGERLDAIRSSGIRLEGAFGDHVARVGAAQVLPAAPDLALIAVQVRDAAPAAEAHAALLGGVPTVVIQNGLRGAQALAPLLPVTPLIGGLTMLAASMPEPGRVVVTARGETVLGPATATRAETAAVAAVLAAALPVRTVPDLLGAQWSKLAVNELNAGSAITGLPAQQAYSSPALRRAIAAAMREAVRVGRARGVPLTGVLRGRDVAALGALPPALSALVVRRLVARMGPVPNPGSTLSSLRRGRPTEIDDLSGAVVREGITAGVGTPVNDRIVELVHAIERGAPHLPPEEAAADLLGRVSRRPRTPDADAPDR